MEPNDLNSLPPDDAQLEAWYCANVPVAPLSDDGFSQRVLAALPPAVPKRAVLRMWFCLGGALVGIVIAAIGVLSADNLTASLPALEDTILTALTQLSVPAFGLALGITLISLWFAFPTRLRL